MENRVPHSPQQGIKALNINDLEPFSYPKRDNNETVNSLSDTTIYDALVELSERKKMRFFNPIPNLQYRSCSLTEGKEWYISYYAINPETNKLKRFRIKVNRIKPIKERRKVAREMMAAIDQRLAVGWNPLTEAKSPKAYTKLLDAFFYFLKVKEKDSEENTIRSYRSFIKTLSDWLVKNGAGDCYSSSFNKQMALQFMDEMEMKLSAKTYNNYVAFYRSMFAWMQDRGYMQQNPFDGILKKAKKLTKKARRVLTDEELTRLFSYLQKENYEYLAMSLICYCCFIRPKEIALLRCRDVDLNRQLIHVGAEISKNDNESYRTIPNELVAVLKRLDFSHPEWYLFGQHIGTDDFTPAPEQICSRKIAKWWDQHVRPDLQFGQDLQFYSLKDTGITNMLELGIPINLVQQQADHSSVAMTAIYVGSKPVASEELQQAGMIKKKSRTSQPGSLND